MKHIFYLFATISIALSSCEKDGTEKRCSKGYTGANCDQEITPAKIQVTRLECSATPQLDNGDTWDALGGKPDIYLILREKSSGNVIFKSGVVDNINPGSGAWSDLSASNILINMPTSRYSVEAWDYDDTSGDDFMGYIEFTPYTNGENFPSTKNLQCSGCNTTWKLNMTYLF